MMTSDRAIEVLLNAAGAQLCAVGGFGALGYLNGWSLYPFG